MRDEADRRRAAAASRGEPTGAAGAAPVRVDDAVGPVVFEGRVPAGAGRPLRTRRPASAYAPRPRGARRA